MSTSSLLCTLSFILLVLTSAKSASSAPQVNIGLAPFSAQLSQPTITAIHRDKAGFLWVGTQFGLNRFDGSKNIIFNSSDELSHWIPGSDISQIAEDSSGNLWIATYGGGLARYDENDQRFYSTTSSEIPGFLYLTALNISKSGTIWFGTRNAGIGAYDPKLERFILWLSSHPLNSELKSPSDIIEDSKGYIWTYGNKKLYRIDPFGKAIEAYTLPQISDTSEKDGVITALGLGPEGLIYLGTSFGAIFAFDPNTLAFQNDKRLSHKASAPIREFSVGKKNLWIATDNGLLHIDRISSEHSVFNQSNSSLSTHGTISLYKDTNSLLVGTHRGLYIISSTFFEKFQYKNSKVFDDVLSFTEDLDGASWIGTFDGLYKLNPNSKTHTPHEISLANISLLDRRVMALAIKKRELWIGFFHGGLQVIDLENGTTRIPNFSLVEDFAVTQILHTLDNVTWVGTYNRGLFRISDEGLDSFYKPKPQHQKLPELAITLILEIDDGSIIVGAETTAYQIDNFDDAIREIRLKFLDGRAPPIILSMAQHSNGDIWIGTKDQGLFIWHYQPDSKEEIQLELAKGNSKFPSGTIYAIEFDEAGFAWISTTKGITKLSGEGEFIRNFKESDGLQGSDFNFSASFRDSKGRLYFGGNNGYNRFDPAQSATKTDPPPVVLTGLNIAGIEPRLPVAVHKLQAVELSHRDYFVTFTFSVLDYADPANNRYKYKLDNFDPQWIENDTRNTATYTNLPPGIYTFRVRGASSAGVWNMEGVSLQLIVHPSPWLGWQAYLIYILSLVVLTLLGKKYYDNTVLRRQATAIAHEMHLEADRATDNLQEQLEYQDDFVKNVHAHNLSTLALIANFTAEQARLFEDDLVEEAFLSNANRVTALTLLEDCLLYQGDQLWANMESYTNAVIDQLLREIPQLAPTTTTMNEVTSRLLPAKLATPLALVIFELLRNCFQHAFEGTADANYIHIRMESCSSDTGGQTKLLKLSVQDNGVGIPDNISPDSVETSGLQIVSSLASAIGGTLHITSKQGTLVSLIFPEPPGII